MRLWWLHTPVMVQRAYKFRFYPTPVQERQLRIEFGHARFVWNWALDLRSRAYKRWGFRRLLVSMPSPSASPTRLPGARCLGDDAGDHHVRAHPCSVSCPGKRV